MIGIVLAGGLSRRMKQDKAALPHPLNPQQSLLDFALEQLLKAGCDKVMVSGDKFGGLADRFIEKGPLAGIFSAIEHMPDKRFLVIPVDMPLLDHALLQELIDYAKLDHHVYFSESQFPMVITADDSIRHYLEQVLQNDNADRSIKQFFEVIGARAVNCSEPDKLLNTNTPQELAAIG